MRSRRTDEHLVRGVSFVVPGPLHAFAPVATDPAPGGVEPMILVSDHRGLGLAERLAPLGDSGFALQVTSSLRETRRLIGREAPTLIVLDPLATGGQVELEEVQRLAGRGALAPLLLVCDRSDPLPALEAARGQGARPCDLVYRDAPLEEFLLRIERLLAQARHRDEIDELRYRATHDDRTDLLRPRFFQSRLVEHVSAAQRHGLELGLVLIDLDDFGRVNKDFDHTVGDLVIARVGEAIRRSLRAEDVAGRLGGDEFGVILPYSTPVDAAHVVQRLLEEIRHVSERSTGLERELHVSGSVGFETLRGSELDSVETLRHHAELALRHSKRTGGDRGTYYRSLLAD